MREKGLLIVLVLAGHLGLAGAIWDAFQALEQARTSTTQGKSKQRTQGTQTKGEGSERLTSSVR